MTAQFPLINGLLHSWASAQIDVNATPFYGITALNFSDELEMEGEYGPSPIALGGVIKQYKASVDLEMILSERDRLIAKLGNGFGKVPFNIGAQWIESTGQPTSTVGIIGARISKMEQSNAPGAAKVKLTLFQYLPIVYTGGLTIFSQEQQVGDIGSLVSGVVGQVAASFGF